MSTRTRSERRRLRITGALLLALVTCPPARAADDDPMAPYRERFKAGMERYQAADFSAAIAAWEAIYRDVGPEKGYRVAFDLARAYDKAGDAARAAEKYAAFVRAVDARRARGGALEPIVMTEETEARTRLAELPPPSETPPVVPVAPAPAPPIAPAPAPPPMSAPPAPPPAAPVASVERRSEAPFPAAVVVVAGGATVAAIVVGVVEYARALSAQSSFDASSGNPQAQEGYLSTYDGARPLAYAGLGASIGLAAITGGLTAWYFAGTKTREVSVAPALSSVPGGAEAGAIVRF